ncbi:MAG TPA: hypothetical protein VMS73_03480, partial [Anaerolineaceae bacterium]|nr:hypothetical protein [Anaerolineaceae bacterium]
MVTLLISTKYHIPPLAPQRVPRSRLLAGLDELLLPGKRLGLVSALAGSGKTTLVRAWVEHCCGSNGALSPFRVAWLSLDEEDNDPGVFIDYCMASVKAACPEIDLEPSTVTGQGSFSPPSTRLVMANVVNQLALLAGHFVWVFDDYHVITSTALHEAMAFLIEHLPDCARLVIITRAESLLPVSRLRARAQLVEIRERDLRFTPGESAVFLNEIMGLKLNPTENELLVERTEGWAAGLQMAALALKALPDAAHQKSEFVHGFSGSHRFVLDYLMDEVFSRLPEQTQSFLLMTAVLDRFSPDLCRAILGESMTGRAATDFVEQQLTFLSQSHLFAIPLDDKRCWYRYHHLFVELLRNRMRQGTSPDEIADRLRRAGAWFAGQGQNPEAIHYFLLTRDFEQAADLIETCVQEIISSGRLTMLNQWLASLPESILAGRPRLRIFQALACFLKGDSATAIAILEDTWHELDGLPVDDSSQTLKRELVSILAISSIAGANAQRVLSLAQDTLATMPGSELIPRARLLFAVGMTYAMASDKRYYTMVKEAFELARKAGDVYLAANILNMQAMGAVFFQAQYRLARQLYEQIIQMASSELHETLPLPASLGFIGQAAIALEWNDLEQAAYLLEKGVALCRQVGQASPSFSALLVRARLAQAREDFDAARREIEEAASQRAFDDNIAAVAQLAQAQVRLHLAMEQSELAEQCANGAQLPSASRPGPGQPALVQEVWGVLRARVLLAQGRPAEALALLEPIVLQAKNAGRMARVVEGSLYQAMALHTLKQDALEPLKLSLAISQPQGITRLYLEAGQGVSDLLRTYLPRLGELSAEADRLLQ